MIKPDIFRLLEEAVISWSGETPLSILPLPVSGSTRQYFRIKLVRKSVIAAWSGSKNENIAFIHFTKHFRKLGLHVPELLFEDLSNNLYLLEDLGDETLFSFMTGKSSRKVSPEEDGIKLKVHHDRNSFQKENTAAKTSLNTIEPFPDECRLYYQLALKHLIRFQLEGGAGLDFSLCVPRSAFDEQSILWDLQYFKYYVLRLFNISFDEQKLEDDFKLMSRLLGSEGNNYFMYRDFQSRNILIYNNDLYFVDYQGGRMGPLQYDLASVLYESSINLPDHIREELLDFYVQELLSKIKVDKEKFRERFYQFVLLRIMQVLAAYGLRGYVQNKAIFLKSYPFAIDNLEFLIKNGRIKLKAPELFMALQQIMKIEEIRGKYVETGSLEVYIHSFSFRYGVPKDFSGNGGGFVFDCRVLPNPGRFPEFREMTGKDEPVIKFLEQHHEVEDFLGNIRKIMDISIKDYLDRHLNRLMVSFGCTGGQHRSVYCAEKISEYISAMYKVKTIVTHGFYKNIGKE